MPLSEVEVTGKEGIVGVTSRLPCSTVGRVEGPAELAAETSIDGGGAWRRKDRCSISLRPGRLVNDEDFEEASLCE